VDAFLDAVDIRGKRSYKELSVFLVARFKPEFKPGTMGFSALRRRSGRRFYAGYAVITSDYLRVDKRQYIADDASIFAHELGHLLLDDNHVSYKNFMADRQELKDGSVTEEQCSVMNKDPYGFLSKN
jgi:hypothetical protein